MFDSNKSYLVTTHYKIGRADAVTAQRVFDRIMLEFPDAKIIRNENGDISIERCVPSTWVSGEMATVALYGASIIKPGDWYDRPNAGQYKE